MGDCGKICGSVFVLLLFSAIPIAMICLGALHKDECPMEPWIPIFMIVTGAVTLLSIFLSVCLGMAKAGSNSGILRIVHKTCSRHTRVYYCAPFGP